MHVFSYPIALYILLAAVALVGLSVLCLVMAGRRAAVQQGLEGASGG